MYTFPQNKLYLYEGDNRSLATPKRTAFTYTIGIASDPGKRRSRNEDSVFAATNLWNTYTSPSSPGLRELIQTALNAGGGDNVSALIISIVPVKGRPLIPGIQRLAIPDTIQLPQT